MLFEFLPEGFGIILLGLWLYCIFDVIASEEMLIRNLPKTLWLLIVIFLPDVGSLAWLLLGRPLFAGWRPGDTSVRTSRAIRGPEDRADWAPPPAPKVDDEARLRAWEEDLRRRERAIERPDEPDGD